jgi:polar amino acid transport system substrate-binding protein
MLRILLAAACAVSYVFAGEKVILVGDDDYAPYSYVEQGTFKGMYIEILERAAKRLRPDYDVELQPRPWKRGLRELETGASFALFPPGLKRERTYIDPYSVPIYREMDVLFCNDAIMKTPRKNFPDDFVGLTVGVNDGFLLSDRLIQAAKQGKVRLEPAKGNDANLKKLAMHRIDCYASDRAAAVYSVKQLRSFFAASGFTLQEAVELSGEDTFIGYSTQSNPSYKADFIQKMNHVIEAMKKDGEIDAIIDGYLH